MSTSLSNGSRFYVGFYGNRTMRPRMYHPHTFVFWDHTALVCYSTSHRWCVHERCVPTLIIIIMLTSLHLPCDTIERVRSEGTAQPAPKNRIFLKKINANWFFLDSHWMEIWRNHLCPSMGRNGGSITMDLAEVGWGYRTHHSKTHCSGAPHPWGI